MNICGPCPCDLYKKLNFPHHLRRHRNEYIFVGHSVYCVFTLYVLVHIILLTHTHTESHTYIIHSARL